MLSPHKEALLRNYTAWALTVSKPMALEYANRTEFVTVTIPQDFIKKHMCTQCNGNGPHGRVDHVVRIILSANVEGSPGSPIMTMFNDLNEYFIIQPDTDEYKLIEPKVEANNNACLFYGKIDNEDRTTMYVDIEHLPPQ